MKKTFVSNMLLVFLVILTCMPIALATEGQAAGKEIVQYSDGSYLVVEINVETNSATKATHEITGTKTAELFNANDVLMMDVIVTGVFTYDGETAEADSATYSYQIYNSGWKFKSGQAYCQDNQAIAKVKFSQGLFVSRTIEAVLTCSPDGKLS